MRGDPSDLIALATAFGLSALQEPEVEILTFSLTGSSRVGAAYTEAVARFYTTAALRNYPERFRRYRGLAIGLDDSGDIAASQLSLAETLARKDSGGKPLYPQQVHEFTDTADPVALMRNALTAQDDQSCAVVLNGPATNLARLLGLRGGPELISSKVKRLVAALGNLPSPAPDNHLMADVAAARKLFAEWPTPITAIGAALGEKVGFDWTENHPIVDPGEQLIAGFDLDRKPPYRGRFSRVRRTATRSVISDARIRCGPAKCAVRPEFGRDSSISGRIPGRHHHGWRGRQPRVQNSG